MEEDQVIAVTQVVNALFKRAVGLEVETVEILLEENKKKRVKRTRRQLPPDTPALIFLLKNRRPEDWRTKPAPMDREIVVRMRPITLHRHADPDCS